MAIKKKPLLFLSGVLLTTGIIQGVAYANEQQAERQPEEPEIETVKQEVTVEKSEEVLAIAENLSTEAETLNNDIQMEIERIREERRLEQERAERAEQERLYYISSVKSNKFVNYDLRQPSGFTGEQLEKALNGTGLEGLGVYYAKAEQEYNVNALALIGISALESSWGTSKFARERNNLFGYQAYDSNVNAAKHFATKEEAIMTVASHLSRNYLTEGGPYHNGYTLESVNVRYASDKAWSSKIIGIINRIVEDL